MRKIKTKILIDWMRKIHQLEYAHRFQSIHYSNLERWIGISALVFTTLVATSYQFPKIDHKDYENLFFLFKHEYIVPVLSTIAAILTGVSTLVRTSERAEIHKNCASRYETLRHCIELVLSASITDAAFELKVDEIKNNWDNIDAINVSDKFFKKGKERVNSLNKYPTELSFLTDIVT